VAQRERQVADCRLRRRRSVDSANDRRADTSSVELQQHLTYSNLLDSTPCESATSAANASCFVQSAHSAVNRLRQIHEHDCPGKWQVAHLERRGDVSRTAAEPFLVVGEHRVQAPPHRGQVRSHQRIAAGGARLRMGEKRLDLLDRQRSR
jgi:hypothetical protein